MNNHDETMTDLQELYDRFKELLNGNILSDEEKEELSRKILQILHNTEEEILL